MAKFTKNITDYHHEAHGRFQLFLSFFHTCLELMLLDKVNQRDIEKISHRYLSPKIAPCISHIDGHAFKILGVGIERIFRRDNNL